METNAITGEIVRSAMKVHTELGPGLLESVYRVCLCHELTKCGLIAVQEKAVAIRYDGIVLNSGLRLDVLVENRVVVEIKSVDPGNSVRLCAHPVRPCVQGFRDPAVSYGIVGVEAGRRRCFVPCS
jgi:GxxExxY protein